MNVTPFRITAEDLVGVERKVRNGLQPLFEALNNTLGQLVSAAGDQAVEQIVPYTLAVGAVIAESFPLVFKHGLAKPAWVGMVCNPRDPDHAHTDPRVMQGFQLTDAGLVSVPFITGLLADNTYDLIFLVK